MFRRNFFGSGPWNPARSLPTVRMAGQSRARLGQGGRNGCIVPGTQERPVFDYNPTTRACGVSWMDTSTADYPECVRAPEGYLGGGHNGWIPPSCMPVEAPPPGGGLPPGFACPTGNARFTIVDYRTGAIIAENVIPEDFPKYVSDMTVLPPGRSCDDDPRCKPICGTAEAPPPPSSSTTPLPSTVACPMGNGLFSLVNASDGSLVADNIPRDQFPQYSANVTDLAEGSECSSDSRCAPVCSVSTAQPPYSDDSPAAADVPATPSVTPGASVPIIPQPFPNAPQPPNLPIRPGLVPNSAPPPVPQKGFAPASINPSCKLTPYKTRMFAATTHEARPDEFVDKEQWTR